MKKAIIKIKTKSEAEAEEAFRIKCRTREVTTTERDTYEKCIALFKSVCLKVRESTAYKNFRGGYDECVELAMDAAYVGDAAVQSLGGQLTALNSICNYEASKIGIVSPDWWKECWKDELG